MKLKNNISISESGFVFDAQTGESFSLNPIAKEILQLLKLDKTEDEIKEYIFAKYEVDEITFSKHLDDFLQMLVHYNLDKTE
ncbi:PqqD family protein [Labilibacter marinus]|uniref:PqqD family protein n=1 Tax=Labilibacter marinus TaxID=1477105 RepID=UPI0009501F5C|nr:PqqD family protein [Labilibacter marinus]